MRGFKLAIFLLLIIVCYNLNVNGVQRDRLPNPKLSSSEIEWWFPTYINPHANHLN